MGSFIGCLLATLLKLITNLFTGSFSVAASLALTMLWEYLSYKRKQGVSDELLTSTAGTGVVPSSGFARS